VGLLRGKDRQPRSQPGSGAAIRRDVARSAQRARRADRQRGPPSAGRRALVRVPRAGQGALRLPRRHRSTGIAGSRRSRDRQDRRPGRRGAAARRLRVLGAGRDGGHPSPRPGGARSAGLRRPPAGMNAGPPTILEETGRAAATEKPWSIFQTDRSGVPASRTLRSVIRYSSRPRKGPRSGRDGIRRSDRVGGRTAALERPVLPPVDRRTVSTVTAPVRLALGAECCQRFAPAPRRSS